ncbi:hypothetical protein KKE28_00105, partial [Patescibacteria group bacterium]|nr:hypothetical protein [Patescibacteria group bacterium]
MTISTLTPETEKQLREQLDHQNATEEFGGKAIEKFVAWLKIQPTAVINKYLEKPELLRNALGSMFAKTPP